MKLIAVGVQFVAYVLVQDDPKEAIEVVDAAIRSLDDPLKAIDSHALEVMGAKDVSIVWADQVPFVAASVTDDDFASITAEGGTVQDILKKLRG